MEKKCSQSHSQHFEDKKQNSMEGEENENEIEALSSEADDFLDAFLYEMEKTKANDGNGNKEVRVYSMKNLVDLCFDIWAAGLETTASTISFLVLYLLLDQEAQRKLHEELDRFRENQLLHSGGESSESDHNMFEQPITLADRVQLPYLNAVINETQRLCNLLPLNLLHKTMTDVKIAGFNIPSGTSIVPQICCVLYDEKVFSRPNAFLPERFLNSEGQPKKVEEFVPFGIGKRQCIGEALARMELFLFTANFFNKFWVLPSDPLHPPSVDKQMFMSVLPLPFTCRIEARNRKQ